MRQATAAEAEACMRIWYEARVGLAYSYDEGDHDDEDDD